MAGEILWDELELSIDPKLTPEEEHQLRLGELQRAHHLKLKALGIYDKILDSSALTSEALSAVNDFTQAHVHVKPAVYTDNYRDRYDIVGVRLTTPNFNASHEPSPHVAIVDLVKYFLTERSIEFMIEDISYDEANTLIGMASEIKQAKSTEGLAVATNLADIDLARARMAPPSLAA